MPYVKREKWFLDLCLLSSCFKSICDGIYFKTFIKPEGFMTHRPTHHGDVIIALAVMFPYTADYHDFLLKLLHFTINFGESDELHVISLIRQKALVKSYLISLLYLYS